MKEPMKPVDVVTKTFGGVRATARALGVSPGAVSRWRKGAGKVPGRHHERLIAKAKELRKRLTANDLVFGRA